VSKQLSTEVSGQVKPTVMPETAQIRLGACSHTTKAGAGPDQIGQ
jgi:hypothetical protein